MMESHRQALRDLSDLQIQTPSVPIIDGTGKFGDHKHVPQRNSWITHWESKSWLPMIFRR